MQRLSDFLSRLWPRDLSRDQKIYLGLVYGILFFGVLLRSLGYFSDDNGLWNDEANWVLRMRAGVSGGNIRPPGYLALSKVLIQLYPSEQLLRAPSYLSGIGSLFLFLAVGSRAKLSRVATILGLGVLAFHPWAVAYAKEFKPYGPELFFQLLLIHALLRYAERASLANMAYVGVIAPLSVLFAWSAVFLFPGVFLALLAIQYRNGLKKQFFTTFGLALVGATAIVLLHFARFQRLFSGKRASGEVFWGNKYGVFFLERKNLAGKFGWMVEKSWDLASFPGRLHSSLDPSGRLGLLLGGVCGALAILGIVLLFLKREWLWGLLLLCPWLCMGLANWLGLWPYGVFRTNVFALVYPLGLALYALTTLSEIFSERALASASALLLLPFLPVDFEYFRYKDVATNAFASSIGTSLEVIQEKESKSRGPLNLYLDGYACGTYRYYTKIHPTFAPRLRKIASRAKVQCSGNAPEDLAALVRRDKGPGWIITARPQSAPSIRAFHKEYCRPGYDRLLGTPDTLLHCVPR